MPDAEVEANPEAYYDRVIRLDLSALEPHVVGPHSPDRARPISKFASEIADSGNGFVDKISTALIGSCTNSSYEDMSRAADIAAQATAHGIKAAVPLLVTPGSEQVRATIERDGQMQSLKDINATVLANACGPCIGQWRRASEAAGAAQYDCHVVQPQLSTAKRRPADNDELHRQPRNRDRVRAGGTSIVQSGERHSDRWRRQAVQAQCPRSPRPRCRRKTSRLGDRPTSLRAKDGQDIELKIDADSERLQRLEPWPAWDGGDFLDMPVLLKSKGKTTTDHISPAGPWLRYRGHLDKFSDNMFMGATNAFTGKAGHGKNVLSGETDQSFQKSPATTNRAVSAGWWSAISITAKAAAASTPRSHRGFSAAWR